MLVTSIVPRFVPFYRTFTVLTGSMEPAIPAGSLVVLRPANAKDLRPGDIISFTLPNQAHTLVTHRIAAVRSRDGAPVFVTKGDANGEVDAWQIPATGTGWRVAFHIPSVGTPIIWLGRPVTKLAVAGALLVMLSAALIRRIWRSDPEDGTEPAPEND